MQSPFAGRSVRRDLMLTVASLAMVAFAGTAFAPTQAMAADVVCAPNASGTAIASATEACTGAGDRVDYGTLPALQSSTVTLTGVTINNTTPAGIPQLIDGVNINSGLTSQTVLSSGAGSITAVGGNGINMTALSGSTGTLSVGAAANRFDIPITGGNVAGTQGIFIQGRGDVNIFTGNAAITSNATAGGSWAIRAQDVAAGAGAGGAIVIDTQGPLSALRGGILGTSAGTDASDSVTITTAGTVTSMAGTAIEGRSINANTTISAGAAVLGSLGVGTGGGIVATISGTGNASITTLAGATVTSTGATDAIGVSATSGTITVNTSAGGAIAGGRNGIATTATTGATTIAAGAVTGAVNGISAASTGGGIAITAGNVIAGDAATGANSSGISAVAGGAGAVTVALNNNAAVSVLGDNSYGINAQSDSGDVSVTTGTGSSIIVAPNGSATNEDPGAVILSAGIRAFSGGDVTVVSNGTINATNNSTRGAHGISASAFGPGSVTITVNGNVTANNTTRNGIRAQAAGGGTVTVNNNATVRGVGADGANAAIRLFSGGGVVTLNNNATGVIQSVGGLATDFAVSALDADTGPVIINNAGRIVGRLDLSGASSSVFNNTSVTSWHMSGTSTFTNGNDVFNNTSTGLLATRGATTVAGLGGADAINNAGTIIIGETAGASSLSGTKTGGSVVINNSGQIILGSLNGGAGTDGETNDQLLAAGVPFIASGNSTVRLDAALGAGTQSSCTAASAVSDCIAIGPVSGTGTAIIVNDTNSAGPGALNFTGTVVVDATSASTGDFFLNSTSSNVQPTPQGLAIPKGFVQYQLLTNAAGTEVRLVGIPRASMLEMVSLPAGLQNIWNTTSEGVTDRLAIRQNMASGAKGDVPMPAQAGGGLSFWGKVSYSDMTRNTQQTASILTGNFVYDTSYTQGTIAILGGVDTVVSQGNGSTLLVGLLAGYDNSVLRFDADRTKATYRVFNIGGYASYMTDGGLSADLLVKDDIARVDLSVPGVAGLKDLDGNSFGIKGTIGQRIGMGTGGIFFQPLGSLAYVRTTMKNIGDPSATFNFADANSMRGTIGVNVGTETEGEGGFTYRPLVFLGVGHEFEGKNRVDITSGTTSLSLRDKPIKTFGIASVGLNVFSQGGMAGFVKGDRVFSDDTSAWQIQAGLRFVH